MESYEWELHRINLPDGQNGVICYYFDSTKIREAEEALEASEERLRAVLDNSRDVIVRFNLSTGRIDYVTPNTASLVGYEPEEYVNMDRAAVLASIHPDDMPAVKAAQEKALVEGKADVEYRQRHKNGEYTWVSNRMSVIKDETGKPIYRLSSIHDIGKRKRAEEDLERASRRINEILSSIQDDFYVLDRNWVFVYANRQFTSRLGKETEDFIGNNIWEMFPKHLGTPFEENLRAAMEKREVQRFEIGGKYTAAWYRMTAYPSAEGITVLGTDITEQKKLDKAKDEFISLVSHELRTPLTIMLGSLKTAATPGLTHEDVMSLVTNAIEGGESMDIIINNLLELSRSQAGRLVLNSGRS